MAINISQSISTPSIRADVRVDSALPSELPRGGVSNDAHQISNGPLEGRKTALGDGDERKDTMRQADESRSFFKKRSCAFTTLGQRIKDFFTTSRESRLDQVYAAQNTQRQQALSRPLRKSVVNQPGVLAKLEKYAKTTHSPLSGQQLKDFVVIGERVALALRDAPNGRSPLSLKGDDGTHFTLDSGIHSTRALSWYMMALGAAQDVERDNKALQIPSAMPTNGSFVMKDPGNRVYEFLSQAPTAACRMSTHFNERSDTRDKHKVLGLFPTDKPSQRGIEDYRSMLPGSGGALLFDKLRGNNHSQELFVKFEAAGCPALFSAVEPHEGISTAISRFFPAVVRNLHHALSFLQSRGGAPAEGRRQEHVHKGLLKESVYNPCIQLIAFAEKQGMNLGRDVKSISRSIPKLGLPGVHIMLGHIVEQANRLGKPDIATEAAKVQLSVGEVLANLGTLTDLYNIDRRGAEVHIELDQNQRS